MVQGAPPRARSLKDLALERDYWRNRCYSLEYKMQTYEKNNKELIKRLTRARELTRAMGMVLD